MNIGEECKAQFGCENGHCPSCGRDGLCCKKGVTGCGCSGRVGGGTRYECTRDAGMNIYRVRDIWQLFGFKLLQYTCFFNNMIKITDVQNEGKSGCFWKCGAKWGWGVGGPCESMCGKDGICCKMNLEGNGCDGTMGMEGKGHVCVEKKKDIQHEGQDCWTGCGSQQGPCDWCGKDGMCCRKGHDWVGNGCDGCLGVEGKGHVCVKKPYYL